MLSTTIQNTKRIILPAILLSILLGILLIASLVVAAIFLHTTKEQVPQFFQSLGNLSEGWHPVFLIPPIVLSFFTFTQFFFSLEHKGLLASINNSFTISFRHLPYLSLVMILGIISYSATSFLPVTEFWWLFLRFAISLYVGLVVTASSLLYYQKNIS